LSNITRNQKTNHSKESSKDGPSLQETHVVKLVVGYLVPGESNLGPNPEAPNAGPLETKQNLKNYSLMHAFESYI
jgi:hypothetical protein